MLKRATLALVTLLALAATAAANWGVGTASWSGLYQPEPPKELQ